MKGEGVYANSILKKSLIHFSSKISSRLQTWVKHEVNMESKLKTEKYGILQITERNINKYQNDDGIVFMDVFDFLQDKDSIWKLK